MSERVLGNQDRSHANSASKTSRYRPEIDGLRAFAVVAVIINHFNKDILPGGYLGVDIFFVISGYVITSSLFGRPSKDFKDFISGFYERRIKRLVPALSVFVLITSIAICLFNPSPGLSLRTGLASLFGLSNLYLLKQSTDYFAQSTELNVFTHTWSLGVEEQFYILFPFLIRFSGFGRQTKNGARNLFLVVGALTIASLVGFLYLYPSNQPAAYFLMPSRFWEMAAGCLIFIGFQKRASIEQLLEKVPPLLVVALIVGVMYLPMSLAAASTIAVVALSSILIASLKKQTAAFKVFTNTKVVYIGLISYSLYLWHWGVLSISRWTIGILWWSVPFQVALMLGLAVASYRWIETPLRKGNWFGKRWKTLVVGGGVLIMVSGGTVALAKGLSKSLYSGKKTNNDYWTTLDKLKPSKRTCNQDLPKLRFKKCVHSESDTQLIAVLGESHALHLSGIMNALSSEHSPNIAFRTPDKGLFLPYPPPASVLIEKSDISTKEMNNEVQSIGKTIDYLLGAMAKGDIILFSSYLPRYFESHFTIAGEFVFYNKIDNSVLPTSDALIEWRLELDKIASKANSSGINIVLIKPLPQFIGALTSEACGDSEWFRRWNRVCNDQIDRTIYEKQTSNIRLAMNELKSNHSNVYVFEPLDAFCGIKYCYRTQDNSNHFYDSNHMSVSGADRLYPSFKNFLVSNGLLVY